MRIRAVGLVVVILAGVWGRPTWAEFRMWTDSKGKTIEAEHVRTTPEKVVLRQQDGTELSVSLDHLSEKDRRYAILLAPPRVEIAVSPKTERKNEGRGGYGQRGGFQIQSESVRCGVSIRKASAAPYEAPLVSEVYLLGRPEQKEFYVVLDRTVSSFRFSAENNNQHRYESGMVTLRQLEAGRQTGVEYAGYLAIVRDRAGNILAIKCSKLDFEGNAAAIIGSEKGTVFDDDFKLVGGKKADRGMTQKPREPKRRWPGRRF